MTYWTRPVLFNSVSGGVIACAEIMRDGKPVFVECNVIAPNDRAALEKLTDYMRIATVRWNRGEFVGRTDYA